MNRHLRRLLTGTAFIGMVIGVVYQSEVAVWGVITALSAIIAYALGALFEAILESWNR